MLLRGDPDEERAFEMSGGGLEEGGSARQTGLGTSEGEKCNKRNEVGLSIDFFCKTHSVNC